MNNEKQLKSISKFLSLVLRHQPSTINIVLDEQGWVDTKLLLAQMNKHGKRIDLNLLQTVVATNNKKRFAFNEDGSKIRANQGHSVKVALDYEAVEPPATLFHGTATKHLDSIKATGLEKRSRHHVHLSADEQTAVQVGQRHGKPVVIVVLAKEMFEAGHVFFKSENGVWLTESVPTKYLKFN